VVSLPYNEFRKDYLLNRWVVIATERSRRPTDFAKQKAENTQTSICPLCVGNENMTPPAVLIYEKENERIKTSQDPLTGDRTKNWLVRVIPNLFPAFSPLKHPEDANQIFINDNLWNAIGSHEVIVESPVHDEGPADAQVPQLELVVKAYIDRVRQLSSKPYVSYVSIFRNFGKEAGASLNHAHSQIIAMPQIPTILKNEYVASREYKEKNGRCAFCDILKKELASPRSIYENEEFAIFSPYASICPMEFWVVPKRHDANMLTMSSHEIGSFAKALKTGLKALKDVVNDPPYNFGFHLSLDKDLKDCYHWHLEVYPKLSIWAGFEISTGTYINTVTPEAAAESMRKAIISSPT